MLLFVLFSVCVGSSGCASIPVEIVVFDKLEYTHVSVGDKIITQVGEEFIVPKDGAYISNEVLEAMGAAIKNK